MSRSRDFILAAVVVTAVLSLWAIFPLEKKMKLGLDLQGGIHLVLEVETAKITKGTTVKDAVDRAMEIIRNRVDGLGVTEPVIQREGENWIVVQLPGIKDPENAIALIGKMALLEFKLVSEQSLEEFLNKDGELDEKKIPKTLEVLEGRDGRSRYLLESEQLMTGASLATASVGTGDFGEPTVTFELTPEGGREFGKLTGRNIGRQLAIILDGTVYSAPVIRSRIGGGKGVIEGKFSWDEASNLALVLRVGALPAPVTIITKEIVGPTLGQDSIERGKKAAVAGTLLVMIMMFVYYRVSGLIADVGLGLNLLYLLAVMAWLKATVTLPGIAGMALTMGMSVDANVLIFERMREELKSGKIVRHAVESGYRRALVTIIDSHVTTIITAAVLFHFGSGPIRGFAVTLFWGVAISLLTAFFVTRAIFETRKQYDTLSI